MVTLWGRHRAKGGCRRGGTAAGGVQGFGILLQPGRHCRGLGCPEHQISIKIRIYSQCKANLNVSQGDKFTKKTQQWELGGWK